MDDMHELAPFYALGALSGDELADFESHLPACADCRAEIDAADVAVGALARSAAEPAPASLKANVMAEIDRMDTDANVPDDVVPLFRRIAPALVAVAAALAVVFGIGLVNGGTQNRIDAIVAAGDATTVQFAPTMADTAEIVYIPSGEAVFSATGLSQVHETETYQLWLIGADGATPAGIFRPHEDGSALVLLDHTVEPGLVLGLTIEPAGGSPAPTGDVLMTGDI